MNKNMNRENIYIPTPVCGGSSFW